MLDPRGFERRSLARNEFVFRKRDKASAIYWVESGRLRLERATVDGKSVIRDTTTADNFFVEAALFCDMFHCFHCDAVAAEPSGLARETLCRTLAGLERPGAIARTGTHIGIKKSVAETQEVRGRMILILKVDRHSGTITYED